MRVYHVDIATTLYVVAESEAAARSLAVARLADECAEPSVYVGPITGSDRENDSVMRSIPWDDGLPADCSERTVADWDARAQREGA